MSKVTLSNALFEQLGGVNWQQRPDVVMALNTPPSVKVNSPAALEQPELESELERLEMGASEMSAPKMNSVVVLGAGLDGIWQNDTQAAWMLWQNIMQVFEWDESQVVFFDTAHLVSEEMIFSTIEEVIELDVDWVLTMDEGHALSEQLQEGVQVIHVPDMESMLFDPYAKQTFYNVVVSTVNSH